MDEAARNKARVAQLLVMEGLVPRVSALESQVRVLREQVKKLRAKEKGRGETFARFEARLVALEQAKEKA